MPIQLRVLILEDRPADAELMAYELRRAGFAPDWDRVDTESDYLAALDSSLDLILADYSLPQFDALRALRHVQTRGLDVPLIIVSGAIGEDLAVAAIKQGATDYLLKDRLARLGPAISRALEERQLRVAKQQAEQALQREAARARALVRTAAQLSATLDLEGVLKAVCAETANALNVPLATVSLYDPDRDELRFAYGVGLPPSFGELVQPVPRLVLDQYTQFDIGVIITPDVQALVDLPNVHLYRRLDVRTTVGVSLMREGQLVGRLNVGTLGHQRDFTDDELELLRGLASQAAVSIQNAQLFEEIGARREQLQTLSHRLVEVQEEERRHLARELHDEIGQILTGLKYSLEISLRLSPEAAVATLERAAEVVRELLIRVRKMSLDLRPAMLDDFGLLPTLVWHFEQYSAQTGIHIHFEHDRLEDRLLPQLETTAYRIVQEALTNVARHADVDQVTVRLWQDEASLHIQIMDLGRGFEPQQVVQSHTSSGLTGMLERAALLGGRLTIDSALGKGTSLTAELPLMREASGKAELREESDHYFS